MVTHERATAASLGLLRVWVFGIWLIEVTLDPIERLAKLPKGLFNPPGAVGLLPSDMIDDLLEPPVLLGFRILLAAGLAIVVLGAYRRAWVPALVVAGLFAHQGLVRSFSHVNHSELALLYVAAAICCFPLSDAFTHARKRRPSPGRPSQLYSMPFLLAMLVLAATYFATGAARLWKGPALFATDTLHDLVVVYTLDTGGLLGFGDLVARPLIELVPGWGWQVAYVAATLLELAFPLALFSLAARRVLVPAMIAFHLASWMLLGVTFFENILLMVVFSTVTFHRIAAGLTSRHRERPARHPKPPGVDARPPAR